MARQRPMSTRSGLPTAATFVFVNMLNKLRKDFAPEYIAAVFDMGPSFREAQAQAMPSQKKRDKETGEMVEVAYAGYKANRAEMPEDLRQQIPYIHRALEVYRIPILGREGFEADDVIGTLARRAAEAGYAVYVVSSDKDMLQLVDGNVCVLNPPKDNLICDRAKVEELLGVTPEQVIDLMALRGDSIDNVPGAPGIGDKGSVELIQQFGTLDALLERAGEVQKKTYRESLQQNREMILLSKELVTIDCNVPIPFEPELMRAQAARRGGGARAVRRAGVHHVAEGVSLFRRSGGRDEVRRADGGGAGKAGEGADAGYCAECGGAADRGRGARSRSESRKANAEVGAEDEAPEQGSLDLGEPVAGASAGYAVGTDGYAATDAAPVAGARQQIALSVSGRRRAIRRSWAARTARALRELLADGNGGEGRTRCEVHAARAERDGADSGGSRAGRVSARDALHDTMLYSYLLDPTYSAHTLPEVALRRLGLKLSGSLAEAADITLRLAGTLRAEVDAEAELAWLYREIDLPLAFVLHGMEQAGVQLDCQVLAEMSGKLAGRHQAAGAHDSRDGGSGVQREFAEAAWGCAVQPAGAAQALQVRQGEDDFDGAGCAGGIGCRA